MMINHQLLGYFISRQSHILILIARHGRQVRLSHQVQVQLSGIVVGGPSEDIVPVLDSDLVWNQWDKMTVLGAEKVHRSWTVWNGADARCRIDVGGIRNSNHQGFDDFLSDLYQIVIGMASI